eukprot:362969-Chlamydomonas_euryale.AAC.3
MGCSLAARCSGCVRSESTAGRASRMCRCRSCLCYRSGCRLRRMNSLGCPRSFQIRVKQSSNSQRGRACSIAVAEVEASCQRQYVAISKELALESWRLELALEMALELALQANFKTSSCQSETEEP